MKNRLWPASRQTMYLATPILASRMVLMFNNFIAMLLIAHLGHAELSASALIATISTFLLVTGMGVLYAVGIWAGRCFGAEEHENIGRVLRSGWCLAVGVSVPIIAIMLYIAPILHFFRQQGNLVLLVAQYFHALAWGILPLMLGVSCSQFLVAVNKPKVVLVWNAARPFLMLIPGYGLLFGALGFPKIGIAGMAYASSFMSWCIFIYAMSYIATQKTFKHYAVFRIRNGLGYVRKLLHVGWPISMQFGAELMTFAASAIMMGWLGERALAAMQIVIQCNMIVIMIPFGLAQASGILIGQALGRKDQAVTRDLGTAALLVGIIGIAIASFIYLAFPKFLTHFYLNVHHPVNAKTVQLAVWFFMIAAFSVMVDGIRNIVTGSLRGFHDTRVPMWVGILVTWGIGLPLGYVMAFTWHWGPVGIFIAYLIGCVVGSAILVPRFYRRFAIV